MTEVELQRPVSGQHILVIFYPLGQSKDWLENCRHRCWDTQELPSYSSQLAFPEPETSHCRSGRRYCQDQIQDKTKSLQDLQPPAIIFHVQTCGSDLIVYSPNGMVFSGIHTFSVKLPQLNQHLLGRRDSSWLRAAGHAQCPIAGSPCEVKPIQVQSTLYGIRILVSLWGFPWPSAARQGGPRALVDREDLDLRKKHHESEAIDPKERGRIGP